MVCVGCEGGEVRGAGGDLVTESMAARSDFFCLMIRRRPRSTQSRSSAASDVYKRQVRTRDIIMMRKVLRKIQFTLEKK